MTVYAPLYWYGGKHYLVKFLLPLIPQHRTYLEPFAGGARLYWAKPPSHVEILNDLDEGIVNFYRVLRDPEMFPEFHRRISLMPYSRLEYYRCRETWEEQQDPVQKAVDWYYVARASFSGSFARSWSFSVSDDVSVTRWISAIDMLPVFHERLRHTLIEYGDWRKVMSTYEGPETFAYCDPPCILDTRTGHRAYRYEMTLEEHQEFVDYLIRWGGMVMVSGYDHDVYRTLESHGWERREFETHLHTSKVKHKQREKRKEIVWSNPRCVEFRKISSKSTVARVGWQLTLFGM